MLDEPLTGLDAAAARQVKDILIERVCAGPSTTRQNEEGGLAPIKYPGWRRFVADGFSAEVLISEIAAQIVAKVPEGPIRIVGSSIGGHFGYAAALRLQAISREIAGFCAIDTFMITSSEPRPGWKKRHMEEDCVFCANGAFMTWRLFCSRDFGALN